jgi:hypothetical protein
MEVQVLSPGIASEVLPAPPPFSDEEQLRFVERFGFFCILSPAAVVQAISLTATMESRRLQRVKACHKLSTGIAQIFNELAQAWIDVGSGRNHVERRNHRRDRCSMPPLLTGRLNRLRMGTSQEAYCEILHLCTFFLYMKCGASPGIAVS